MAAPVIRDLSGLGTTNVGIVGSGGWISADLTVDALEPLSTDVRLAVISSARDDNVDNACIPVPCRFSATTDIAQEWFLGEGARTQRVDAQQFYDQGMDGSFNQGPHNSLVVGIWEMGLYEDEAFFDKQNNGVSRGIKYNCTTQYGIYSCTARTNLPDVEAPCGITTQQQRWESGCHGTGVASIAVGRNFDNLMSGNMLGDTC